MYIYIYTYYNDGFRDSLIPEHQDDQRTPKADTCNVSQIVRRGRKAHIWLAAFVVSYYCKGSTRALQRSQRVSGFGG